MEIDETRANYKKSSTQRAAFGKHTETHTTQLKCQLRSKRSDQRAECFVEIVARVDSVCFVGLIEDKHAFSLVASTLRAHCSTFKAKEEQTVQHHQVKCLCSLTCLVLLL